MSDRTVTVNLDSYMKILGDLAELTRNDYILRRLDKTLEPMGRHPYVRTYEALAGLGLFENLATPEEEYQETVLDFSDSQS